MSMSGQRQSSSPRSLSETRTSASASRMGRRFQRVRQFFRFRSWPQPSYETWIRAREARGTLRTSWTYKLAPNVTEQDGEKSGCVDASSDSESRECGGDATVQNEPHSGDVAVFPFTFDKKLKHKNVIIKTMIGTDGLEFKRFKLSQKKEQFSKHVIQGRQMGINLMSYLATTNLSASPRQYDFGHMHQMIGIWLTRYGAVMDEGLGIPSNIFIIDGAICVGKSTTKKRLSKLLPEDSFHEEAIPEELATARDEWKELNELFAKFVEMSIADNEDSAKSSTALYANAIKRDELMFTKDGRATWKAIMDTELAFCKENAEKWIQGLADTKEFERVFLERGFASAVGPFTMHAMLTDVVMNMTPEGGLGYIGTTALRTFMEWTWSDVSAIMGENCDDYRKWARINFVDFMQTLSEGSICAPCGFLFDHPMQANYIMCHPKSLADMFKSRDKRNNEHDPSPEMMSWVFDLLPVFYLIYYEAIVETAKSFMCARCTYGDGCPHVPQYLLVMIDHASDGMKDDTQIKKIRDWVISRPLRSVDICFAHGFFMNLVVGEFYRLLQKEFASASFCMSMTPLIAYELEKFDQDWWNDRTEQLVHDWKNVFDSESVIL